MPGGQNWPQATGPRYAEVRAFVLVVNSEKEVVLWSQ